MIPEKKLKKGKKVLPTVKELSFVRRNVVRLITKVQRLLLRLSLYTPYYALAKLHFKIYLQKDLLEETLNGTYEGKAAARRHGRLVIKLFKDAPVRTKKIIYKAAKEKFKKDLILKAEL